MKILRIIHTAFGLTFFILLFALFFFPLLVPILFPKKFNWVGILNRWWARGTFIFAFLPYKVKCESELDKNQQYIFCPNHFSYLDIPTMGLNPINTIFVGKNDMENIPLFGFMYKKLHITVNRNRLRSKYDTFIKSRKAIDDGKSLVIYPEGGIFTQQPPDMFRFKDGAFRLAIEKQIPIVPVTIPNNWIILPADEFLVRLGKVEVIFHHPIETHGLTELDINQLKTKVFKAIEDGLKRYGNQPTATG